MSIFEILITSEDAFEVISCFFIRHCPLKQIWWNEEKKYNFAPRQCVIMAFMHTLSAF